MVTSWSLSSGFFGYLSTNRGESFILHGGVYVTAEQVVSHIHQHEDGIRSFKEQQLRTGKDMKMFFVIGMPGTENSEPSEVVIL